MSSAGPGFVNSGCYPGHEGLALELCTTRGTRREARKKHQDSRSRKTTWSELPYQRFRVEPQERRRVWSICWDGTAVVGIDMMKFNGSVGFGGCDETFPSRNVPPILPPPRSRVTGLIANLPLFLLSFLKDFSRDRAWTSAFRRRRWCWGKSRPWIEQ